MAWVSIDKNGDEYIFQEKPVREETVWDIAKYPYDYYHDDSCIELPKGSIKKLIGKELSWEDDCVELKGD